MKLINRLCGVVAVLAVTLQLSAGAEASAPRLKTQAPGYYRLMLGEFEVTALSDGTFQMDAGKLLTNITPKELDAGAGTLFGPTLGKLMSNLKASGYRPEQIDEIYISHMHGDHIGGLTADGKPVFPNAIVRAAQQEADFWLK